MKTLHFTRFSGKSFQIPGNRKDYGVILWTLLACQANSRCLANILSFVIQNLTQYIHWQS
jgi:hypothetical protein